MPRPTAPDAAARTRLAADAAAPFVPTRPPLYRFRLYRLAAGEHVLGLTLAHLIADGWSVGLLWREVVESYEAAIAGRAAILPELPAQYVDYACWQRDWLRDEGAESMRYWRHQLDGVVPLDLPTDRPRPAVQTLAGGRRAFRIDAEAAGGLESLGRSEGSTLFMTSLAAFAVLLARYSGRTISRSARQSPTAEGR